MSMEEPGAPEVQTPQEQPVEQPQVSQAAAGPSKDEVTMGMLAHLLGLVGFIGPLIIWLIKKDESQYVAEQAKESLNFQITFLIAYIGSMILSVIGIGLVLAPIVWIVDLVFVIMATIQANQGVMYKYPVNWRIIK